MQIRSLILIWLFFFCMPVLQAQEIKRYNTFSYSVNEGLLQSNVLDIAFDQNNFCWLSFANGIQKFDGNGFAEIPIQAGLPDDKSISFFRQKSGSLLFIHKQGISRYNIHKNVFELVYSKAKNTNSTLHMLGEYEADLFLFDEKAAVISLDGTTYRQKSIAAPGLPSLMANQQNKPYSSKIVQGRIVLCINNQLFLLGLKEKKLLGFSAIMPGLHPYFTGLNENDEAIVFTKNKTYDLFKYNFNTRQSDPVYKGKDLDAKSFRGQQLEWDNKKLLGYFNHLYIMASDYTTVQSEIVDFKNNAIAGNSAIVKAVPDNFGNLFLVTMNDGIKKIIKNSYPIKYYGTSQKGKNYIISVYADKAANNILAGTYGNGLLIFDTLQQLKKHIQYLPGETQLFSANAITKNASGDYIFLVHSKPVAYLLGKDLSSVKFLPIKNTVAKSSVAGYFGSLVAETREKSILQAEGNLYIVNKSNNSIVQKNISAYSTHGSMLFKNHLVSHSNEKLSFYDTINFTTIRSVPFANTGAARSYATDGQNIYLGTDKGIFVTDGNGKITRQYNKTNGLPDECIYAMSFDAGNNLWCSTNKGIIKISPKGNMLQLTKNDGLQENEFNTNVVYRTAQNELFFGGVNGLNSFYPGSIPDYMVDIKIYLNQIKVNNKDLVTDTAVWNLNRLVLPYNENSLALDFIASGQKNAGQYIHQYKMEGIDKEWIQNAGTQPVRYLLPPGRYIFKMYASAYFEKDAVALKELTIVIRPPFWKTAWFIALLVIALASIIVYFVNLYNKIRYGKKMAALKTRQKVQEERERMSMELHDSIGAYANAVLYNTELLQAEEKEPGRKEIMKDLRFASKDIITSLRETIWALKNENYPAQECLLRIRNFIHPFTRYYPGIHFRVEGDASGTKELHYVVALNIVRIVQEAVNNAIKHSNPANIIIKSIQEGDAWTLIINDDGKGFNQATTDYGNGIGNMKKRAKEMGFTVEIVSEENTGTRVTVRVS